mmetsp:Transcript_16498/g.53794  ORF Transcript_16498/g.53794 Transcript_16498/m.53794 type:complete len:226 (+) Transcript_16498:3430-4107(+)
MGSFRCLDSTARRNSACVTCAPWPPHPPPRIPGPAARSPATSLPPPPAGGAAPPPSIPRSAPKPAPLQTCSPRPRPPARPRPPVSRGWLLCRRRRPTRHPVSSRAYPDRDSEAQAGCSLQRTRLRVRRQRLSVLGLSLRARPIPRRPRRRMDPRHRHRVLPEPAPCSAGQGGGGGEADGCIYVKGGTDGRGGEPHPADHHPESRLPEQCQVPLHADRLRFLWLGA